MFFKTEESFYTISTESIIRIFFVELIAVASVCLGYHASKYFGTKESGKHLKTLFKPRRAIIFILFIIGLIARLIIIKNCGGVANILSNPSLAYNLMTKQSGYLSILANFMVIAICLLLKYYSKSRIDKVLIVFLVLLYSATFLIFTSRTPILECLLVLLFVYNFSIKKIEPKNLLKPKMLLLMLIAIVIITVLPAFRVFGKSDFSMASVFNSIGKNFSNIFDELSCVGKDSYIYDNVRFSDYWWGRNYLNLFTSFIPNSIYPNKPPIDDGMYLSNLILGNKVLPSMGRNDLAFQSSIPFSTQGCLFINFGIMGVIIGEFLLGILYGVVYRKVKFSKNPFGSYAYFIVIYVLELSTLSLMQAFVPLVLCFLTYLLCKETCIIKRRKFVYVNKAL